MPPTVILKHIYVIMLILASIYVKEVLKKAFKNG